MTATNPETTTTPPQPERDDKGRFARGNTLGRGNPFARQCASLRAALMREFTEANVGQLARKLMEQALAGDVAAARLVLQYGIGKPTPAVDPDDVARLEWEHEKQQAVPMEDVHEAGERVPLEIATVLATCQRYTNTVLARQGLQQSLDEANAPALPEPTPEPEPSPAVIPMPVPVNSREKPARRCANPHQSMTPPRQPTAVTANDPVEPAGVEEPVGGMGERSKTTGGPTLPVPLSPW